MGSSLKETARLLKGVQAGQIFIQAIAHHCPARTEGSVDIEHLHRSLIIVLVPTITPTFFIIHSLIFRLDNVAGSSLLSPLDIFADPSPSSFNLRPFIHSHFCQFPHLFSDSLFCHFIILILVLTNILSNILCIHCEHCRNSSRDKGASQVEIAPCHLFTTSQFSLPCTSRKVVNRSLWEKSILLLSPRTT